MFFAVYFWTKKMKLVRFVLYVPGSLAFWLGKPASPRFSLWEDFTCLMILRVMSDSRIGQTLPVEGSQGICHAFWLPDIWTTFLHFENLLLTAAKSGPLYVSGKCLMSLPQPACSEGTVMWLLWVGSTGMGNVEGLWSGFQQICILGKQPLLYCSRGRGISVTPVPLWLTSTLLESIVWISPILQLIFSAKVRIFWLQIVELNPN